MISDEFTERKAAVESRSGLSHDAIRSQLNRILAHREFQATDKMRDFLRYVVEETLAGRENRIKGYAVAIHVFGRGEDFDAALDPIVRIQAARLRRAMERYYLVAGGRDPIWIDIPKGRYIPRFVAQAEVTSMYRSGARAEPQLPAGPSIAVLPFENLTGDPGQLFLTIGLTEELVTEMSRFQDIIVIPCQLGKRAAGLTAGSLELGKAAGAHFALQGTVRIDTKMVKVATHLTDINSGRQIWAEAFKYPLEACQMIATQEEIARRVIAAIGSEYGIIARRLSAESRKKPPAELDTYEAMLRYYSYQVSPELEAGKLCLAALQSAVDREPDYGPAWSGLATLYCQMYSWDTPGIVEPLDTALRYARRGVSLDPGSQLSRLILSYASFLADDSDSFHHEIETALALNPNSPYTVGAAGYFHVLRGEFERGLALLDRAIGANPYHPDWFHLAYFIDHFRRRNYDRALLELQQHNPLHNFWVHVMYGATLGKLDRIDEARVHIKQVTEQKPDFASRAHELFRRTLKVDAIIEDMIDGLRKGGLPVE